MDLGELGGDDLDSGADGDAVNSIGNLVIDELFLDQRSIRRSA